MQISKAISVECIHVYLITGKYEPYQAHIVLKKY